MTSIVAINREYSEAEVILHKLLGKNTRIKHVVLTVTALGIFPLIAVSCCSGSGEGNESGM